MFKKTPERILTQWLPVCGIVCAMLYYAAFVYQHALNIPYADDIRDILLFLIQVSKAHEWTDTVAVFFAQLNEHRTLSSRLVYYLAFTVQGEANFRTLILIANLGLPLLLLMLYLPIRKQTNALLMLLPAALILFQLRIYMTSFWSMNAFAFIFVFVYAFASLLCLRELSPLRFIAAILCASLGTFTLASGPLIWLMGFVCISHQVFIVRRASTTYLGGWVLAAVAVLAIYSIGDKNANSIAQILGTVTDRPKDIAIFFFVLLGRAFSDGNVALAAGSGTVLLLAVAWSSMRRWRGDDITLELFAWFIILSLLAIALARVSAIAMAQASGKWPIDMSVSEWAMRLVFSPHYAFISVLLLATTVVLLASQLRGNRTLTINVLAAFLACTYCVSSYYFYPARLQKMFYVVVGGHNSKNYWAFGDTTNESSAIVSDAEKLGIYRAPPRPLPVSNRIGSTKRKMPRPPPAAREKTH